jgi:hypothetical protein
MKTRFLVSIAIMLFTVTLVNAETKETAAPNRPTEAAKFLQKNIYYPTCAELEGQCGDVVFELKADENQHLKFIPMNLENQELTEQVKIQIKRLEPKLANLIEPGESQQFKLTFVLK